ncbi:SIR2 family NAD-dependent protein deacylase [Pseudomonas sp. TUM22785]|uniref:SIR2 family NAD-dependent protein deacylase n=1 Tax=Pseudomonas sp. TUM22785 TaxID=3019098 RepID=UPI00230516D5|nr:NAD-dependent deacylase [Pseudomonas sp. TUM22785]WCD82875.1 NAD-dependent deacylase [Pseudomonas sp. TUM22785]
MSFDPSLLAKARHLVVFTGAGISAESGIPTFRDRLTGLWERYEASELASAEGFRRDPALVWGWYEWRRTLVHRAQPNAAHLAIARLATLVPKLTLITQNVDDLHERAGSREALHLHGRLDALRCFACTRPALEIPKPDEPNEGRRVEPPRCTRCNGKLRPGVVWFGEQLPGDVLRAAFTAAEECDLLLSIGTSGVVEPAASIPRLALRAGATVLHLNTQPVAVQGEREFALAGPAGELLPALLRQAFGADA